MVIKHAWYDKNEFDIIISVYTFQKHFKVNVSILGSIATVYYASILVIQSSPYGRIGNWVSIMSQG